MNIGAPIDWPTRKFTDEQMHDLMLLIAEAESEAFFAATANAAEARLVRPPLDVQRWLEWYVGEHETITRVRLSELCIADTFEHGAGI